MEGQAREGVGREGALSAPPHDVFIRESGETASSRTFDGGSSRTFNGPSSRTFDGSLATQDSHQPSTQREDVWAGAIARLQTQVSYNTSMLESHRRQLVDMENLIRKLDQDMGLFANGMRQLQDEFRARPASAQQPRHDAGDLDVISRQIQALTDKVHEVDGLKMQVDLMKNRMRRVEEQGSPAAIAARAIAPAHHDPYGDSQHSRQSSAHPPSRPLHQQLPPMRTSSMGSPAESRPSTLHQPPPPMTVLQSQHSGSSYYPPSDSRYAPSEQQSGQAPSASSYRPGEPLPPPSAISAWRPAEPFHPPSGNPPPPPPPGPVQPRAVQQDASTSSWATVNAHPPTKRSFDEPRHPSYESSMGGGSPKRPKLAPIMPRGAYHDDSSYVPSSMTQSTAESSYEARTRAGSNASQTQSSTLPTPASANAPAYRFITSTAQGDSQESWRPEAERMLHIHQHQPGGRARGRGSRGGGRGRRGGRAAGEQQELGTPEWEKPGWTGSQVSPNGYYQPLHPYSPRQKRGELVRRGGGYAGASAEHEHITPATPTVQGAHDPFAVGHAGDPQQQSSGGKKSRTKPIRNAEGILIRKDGRPDMRSVSSANNLRKVHAKKEAERAEMEGRTPTSARSLAPAGSNSISEEDENAGSGDEREHETTQERHQALMSRIFPHGVDEASRGAGERFFPRQEPSESSAVKSEMRSEERQHSEQVQQSAPADSQMTEVGMRAVSEAQAEGQREQQPRRDEDTKMPTVEEASEEQETDSERQEKEAAQRAQ